MSCSRLFPARATWIALLLAGNLIGQNTQPFWSTYFGSGVRDHAVAIGRGPGGVVMVAGHTTDTTGNLATPGVFQTAPNGGQTDAFVACFDPGLPSLQQLLWCTYFGGTGLELVFDLHVDPATGVTTVVGLSDSLTLPAGAGQSMPTNNGRTDGFMAQFGPMGTVLLSSMFLGGAADDRICDVEVGGSGVVTVAGVTEAAGSLPSAANAYNGGASDAFAALLAPQNPSGAQVLWSHYLGGDSLDGLPYPNWLAGGGLGRVWEGNLDRMGLALDEAGKPAVVTVSVRGRPMSAWTTNNACQPIHADAGNPQNVSDAYLAVLDPVRPPGSQIAYATFFGGPGPDRPQAIALHPGGGFVVGGYTFSTSMPVTVGCLQPNKAVAMPPFRGVDVDGFVCHIDPNPPTGSPCLRYSTYLGGDAGEDVVYVLAVETSGVVTVAGSSAGGTFWRTPRSWFTAGQNGAMVARLELAGNGMGDLHYAAVGGGAPTTNTFLTDLVLDELGDAYVTGYHGASFYPATANAYQTASNGGRDAVITYLPLLPGGMPGVCVTRQQLAFATPACNGLLLHTGMAGAPVPGTTFGITATSAPPTSLGALVLGPAAGSPIPILNGWLLLNPRVTLLQMSDQLGFARFDIAIPSAISTVPCWGLAAQWLFLTTAPCPGSGPLANSERLVF